MVARYLKPFLKSADLPKVGHNLKYDYTVLLQNCDLALEGPLYDTLIAAYLIEAAGRSYKLDDLLLEQGIRLTSFAQCRGWRQTP